MNRCKHERTELLHKVIRLHSEGQKDDYRLEIKLRCLDCLSPFLFKTLKMGVLSDQPTTGVDRGELRIPLIAPDPELSN